MVDPRLEGGGHAEIDHGRRYDDGVGIEQLINQRVGLLQLLALTIGPRTGDGPRGYGEILVDVRKWVAREIANRDAGVRIDLAQLTQYAHGYQTRVGRIATGAARQTKDVARSTFRRVTV